MNNNNTSNINDGTAASVKEKVNSSVNLEKRVNTSTARRYNSKN
jgi:hypothetical protein